MIAGKQPLFVSQQKCDCAVEETMFSLEMAGYTVVRSFDLHSAIPAQSSCACQLVVLLVYGQNGPPMTLIFDSQESGTSVYLAHDPGQPDRSSSAAQLIELLK